MRRLYCLAAVERLPLPLQQELAGALERLAPRARRSRPPLLLVVAADAGARLLPSLAALAWKGGGAAAAGGAAAPLRPLPRRALRALGAAFSERGGGYASGRRHER